MAYMAGAKWIIKRETSRLDLIDTDSTVWTGKTLTEVDHLRADDIHHQQAVRQL